MRVYTQVHKIEHNQLLTSKLIDERKQRQLKFNLLKRSRIEIYYERFGQKYRFNFNFLYAHVRED